MKGIRFRNSNGYTTIDSRYSNTALISAGSASGTGYVDIQVPAGCVAAIRPSLPALTRHYAVDGQVVTRVRVAPHRRAQYLPLTVDYYIFGPAGNATPSGTHGMRIRRQDGSVAYDSRLKYMKVMQVLPSPQSAEITDWGKGGVQTNPNSNQGAIDNLVHETPYCKASCGVKLACILMTPEYTSTSTWPYGQPDPNQTTQDFYTEVVVEAVMSDGNDMRLYRRENVTNFFNVPASQAAPDMMTRHGSGFILVDVTGF